MSRMGKRLRAVSGRLPSEACRKPQMTESADTELLVEDMGAGILRLSEPMLLESERSFFT